MRFFELNYRISTFIAKWSGYDFIRYDVVEPLIRVFRWIPVIWYNFSWSGGNEFVDILLHKMKMMKRDMEDCHTILLDKNDPEYNNPDMVRQREPYYTIIEAIKLAERIKSNPYFDELEVLFKKHYGGNIRHKSVRLPPDDEDKKHGWIRCTIERDLSEISPEKREIAEKVYMRLNKMGWDWRFYKQDVDKLMVMIRENIILWGT